MKTLNQKMMKMLLKRKRKTLLKLKDKEDSHFNLAILDSKVLWWLKMLNLKIQMIFDSVKILLLIYIMKKRKVLKKNLLKILKENKNNLIKSLQEQLRKLNQ